MSLTLIYSQGVTVLVAPITAREGENRREAERRTITALAQILFPSSKIGHRASGAPSLILPGGGSRPWISVSHSRSLAALAVSDRPVGIDIEAPSPKLERVAERFLSPEELASIPNLLRAWTAKEAAFKACPEASLITDFHLAKEKNLLLWRGGSLAIRFFQIAGENLAIAQPL